ALIRNSIESKFGCPNTLRGEDFAPRRGYSAELLKERIGIAKFACEVAYRRGAHDMKDFFGIADRQRRPQRRVEERKYRSVGSDAERESQDSNGGKAGRLAQHSGGEAKVLPTRLYQGFPAARANDFLADFEASPLQADCAKGILAAHALLHLFV